ncbi:MAG: VIT domain-containing protein [bacterium]
MHHKLLWIALAGAMLSGSSAALAYNSLQIQDPRQPWRAGQGTIEHAVVSLRPQGVYTEVGLYLTFSARGLNFTSQDSVEVQLFFDLPKEAIVHDLWLWVDDQIMRALIMDRWSASGIYEDIVKRRRDPAIMFKNSETQYELRIFPMVGTATRKIKLTYLVPAQWSATTVTSLLPAHVLRLSKSALSAVNVLFWPQTDWQTPRVVEFPETHFENLFDAELGAYQFAGLPNQALEGALNIAVKSPMRNGIYLNRWLEDGEGFYQLALLPSELFDLKITRKVAVLLDYDINKSEITASEILTVIRNAIQVHLAPTDSFNLIFSNVNVKRAGNGWFAADSAGLQQAIAAAGANPISNYSNLPALLANGIDFVKTNGNDGMLLLVANSDQFGDYRAANPLINDLMQLMNPTFPIHIADYTSRNSGYHYFGDRGYIGNQYFYENLSRRTNGNYTRILELASFQDLITKAFQSLGGTAASFDLHTTLANGFCFGRFTSGVSGQSLYLDRPVTQIGKFNGAFPFIVETSVFFENEVHSQRLNFDETAVPLADSLSEEIWAGQNILALEAQPTSNDLTHRIIDFSLKERVLSRYTAFLALEPNDTVKVCLDCIDESRLAPTSVAERDKEAPADSALLAYPNPFNISTQIRLRLPVGFSAGEVTLQIYNVMGQAVRTFRENLLPNKRDYQFTWNGRNDRNEVVATGSYFAVFQTPQKRHTLKLLLMK